MRLKRFADCHRIRRFPAYTGHGVNSVNIVVRIELGVYETLVVQIFIERRRSAEKRILSNAPGYFPLYQILSVGFSMGTEFGIVLKCHGKQRHSHVHGFYFLLGYDRLGLIIKNYCGDRVARASIFKAFLHHIYNLFWV